MLAPPRECTVGLVRVRELHATQPVPLAVTVTAEDGCRLGPYTLPDPDSVLTLIGHLIVALRVMQPHLGDPT